MCLRWLSAALLTACLGACSSGPAQKPLLPAGKAGNTDVLIEGNPSTNAQDLLTDDRAATRPYTVAEAYRLRASAGSFWSGPQASDLGGDGTLMVAQGLRVHQYVNDERPQESFQTRRVLTPGLDPRQRNGMDDNRDDQRTIGRSVIHSDEYQQTDTSPHPQDMLPSSDDTDSSDTEETPVTPQTDVVPDSEAALPQRRNEIRGAANHSRPANYSPPRSRSKSSRSSSRPARASRSKTSSSTSRRPNSNSSSRSER